MSGDKSTLKKEVRKEFQKFLFRKGGKENEKKNKGNLSGGGDGLDVRNSSKHSPGRGKTHESSQCDRSRPDSTL